MKENSLPRIVLIVLCTAVFVAVLVVNALAGAGRGEFKYLLSQCDNFNPKVLCCTEHQLPLKLFLRPKCVVLLLCFIASAELIQQFTEWL